MVVNHDNLNMFNECVGFDTIGVDFTFVSDYSMSQCIISLYLVYCMLEVKTTDNTGTGFARCNLRNLLSEFKKKNSNR